MRRTSTETYLTLGMALTADKTAMERRVRGVFAREKSARPAKVLALALCIALGIGCFTTACQPAEGDAGEPVPTPTATPGELDVAAGEAGKAKALNWRDQQFEWNREFPAPRLGNVVYAERGKWSADPAADEERASEAKQAFLPIANALFETGYTTGDVTATYYADETGFRSDIWRLDSEDGDLAGAVDTETLALISADCKTIPEADMRQSVVNAVTSFDSSGDDVVNAGDVVDRIAGMLGTTAPAEETSCFDSYQSGAANGWDVRIRLSFRLDDGRYCSVYTFGDEQLTIDSIGIYPDADCQFEGVYWRADLEYTEGVDELLSPQDFRKGEPDSKDMPLEQAYAIYDTLVTTAGTADAQATGKTDSPDATFYIDDSGTRENYWHLAGEYATLDIASKTGHIFNVVANGMLGESMGLLSRPYEDSENEPYRIETKKLIEAIFGEGSVTDTIVNAGGGNSSICCEMDDGATYDVQYYDGKIMTIGYFIPPEDGDTDLYTNWRADYTYINVETGETFYGN